MKNHLWKEKQRIRIYGPHRGKVNGYPENYTMSRVVQYIYDLCGGGKKDGGREIGMNCKIC